jgi:hypothetical protein
MSNDSDDFDDFDDSIHTAPTSASTSSSFSEEAEEETAGADTGTGRRRKKRTRNTKAEIERKKKAQRIIEGRGINQYFATRFSVTDCPIRLQPHELASLHSLETNYVEDDDDIIRTEQTSSSSSSSNDQVRRYLIQEAGPNIPHYEIPRVHDPSRVMGGSLFDTDTSQFLQTKREIFAAAIKSNPSSISRISDTVRFVNCSSVRQEVAEHRLQLNLGFNILPYFYMATFTVFNFSLTESAVHFGDFRTDEMLPAAQARTFFFFMAAFGNPFLGEKQFDRSRIGAMYPSRTFALYGLFNTPKITILAEILNKSTYDSAGRILDDCRLFADENCVGIRYFFLFHDPNINPKTAIQEQIFEYQKKKGLEPLVQTVGFQDLENFVPADTFDDPVKAHTIYEKFRGWNNKSNQQILENRKKFAQETKKILADSSSIKSFLLAAEVDSFLAFYNLIMVQCLLLCVDCRNAANTNCICQSCSGKKSIEDILATYTTPESLPMMCPGLVSLHHRAYDKTSVVGRQLDTTQLVGDNSLVAIALALEISEAMDFANPIFQRFASALGVEENALKTNKYFSTFTHTEASVEYQFQEFSPMERRLVFSIPADLAWDSKKLANTPFPHRFSDFDISIKAVEELVPKRIKDKNNKTSTEIFSRSETALLRSACQQSLVFAKLLNHTSSPLWLTGGKLKPEHMFSHTSLIPISTDEVKDPNTQVVQSAIAKKIDEQLERLRKLRDHALYLTKGEITCMIDALREDGRKLLNVHFRPDAANSVPCRKAASLLINLHDLEQTAHRLIPSIASRIARKHGQAPMSLFATHMLDIAELFKEMGVRHFQATHRTLIAAFTAAFEKKTADALGEPNILMHLFNVGVQGIGKSKINEMIASITLPGTIVASDSSSLKAPFSDNGFVSDVVLVTEELPYTDRMTPDQKVQFTQQKIKLSEGQSNHTYLEINKETGARTTRHLVVQHGAVQSTNSNDYPFTKNETSFMSRHLNSFLPNIRKMQGEMSLSTMVVPLESNPLMAKITSSSASKPEQIKFMQACTIYLWKAAAMFAIPYPSSIMFAIHMRRLMVFLDEYFPGATNNNRWSSMMANEFKTMTIMHAVHYLFFSEVSPLIQYDATTKQRKILPFDFSQLLLAKHLMFGSEDMAFYILTKYVDEFYVRREAYYLALLLAEYSGNYVDCNNISDIDPKYRRKLPADTNPTWATMEGVGGQCVTDLNYIELVHSYGELKNDFLLRGYNETIFRELVLYLSGLQIKVKSRNDDRKTCELYALVLKTPASLYTNSQASSDINPLTKIKISIAYLQELCPAKVLQKVMSVLQYKGIRERNVLLGVPYEGTCLPQIYSLKSNNTPIDITDFHDLKTTASASSSSSSSTSTRTSKYFFEEDAETILHLKFIEENMSYQEKMAGLDPTTLTHKAIAEKTEQYTRSFHGFNNFEKSEYQYPTDFLPSSKFYSSHLEEEEEIYDEEYDEDQINALENNSNDQAEMLSTSLLKIMQNTQRQSSTLPPRSSST